MAQTDHNFGFAAIKKIAWHVQSIKKNKSYTSYNNNTVITPNHLPNVFHFSKNYFAYFFFCLCLSLNVFLLLLLLNDHIHYMQPYIQRETKQFANKLRFYVQFWWCVFVSQLQQFRFFVFVFLFMFLLPHSFLSFIQSFNVQKFMRISIDWKLSAIIKLRKSCEIVLFYFIFGWDSRISETIH